MSAKRFVQLLALMLTSAAVLAEGGLSAHDETQVPQVAGSDARVASYVAPNEAPRLYAPADTDSLGRELGRFRLTYYWIAEQKRAGSGRVTLRDPTCRPLARVSRGYAKRIRQEGTGLLEDGRLLNVTGVCKCGSVCYFVANEHGGGWGVGVKNRPLEPFRSIAVDPRKVKIGTWVYVPELDGALMPSPSGGFLHDGCLRADDRGGGIKGKQIDFFTGLRSHYRQVHGQHRFTRVTVRKGGQHCAQRVGKKLGGADDSRLASL